MHTAVQLYMDQNLKDKQSVEQNLPVIVREQLHHHRREQVTRPLLTSLAKKRDRESKSVKLNHSMGQICHDSNLRRHHLVLEDIVRNREKEIWFNQQTTLVHQVVNQKPKQVTRLLLTPE